MSHTSFEPATVVRQSEQQLACGLDGETILYQLQTGAYFGCDAIGSRVWQLLERPATVEAICRQLTAEYAGVELAQCQADVIAFLVALDDAGLIVVGPLAE